MQAPPCPRRKPFETQRTSEEAKCDGLDYHVDSVISTNNEVTARHLPSLEDLCRKKPIWEVKGRLPNGCLMFFAVMLVFGT